MDWQIVIWIIMVLLLALAGGYIKKLVKESKELFEALHDAFADDRIDDVELAKIIKEGRDVKEILFSIAKLFASAKR